MKLLTKKQKRSIGLIIFPFIASILIRFLHITNKKVFHAPSDKIDENFIIACWHGELLMMPYVYGYYRKKYKIKALISDHHDGNLIAKTFNYFGFETIRGSSTRGGAKALIQAIKAMKEGYDLGITPDGPKGPRHVLQDGIIVMAKKSNAKIILAEVKPTKYWELKSWDRFKVPKPFGVINIYLSEPIDIKEMDLDEAKKLLKEGLLKHEY